MNIFDGDVRHYSTMHSSKCESRKLLWWKLSQTTSAFRVNTKIKLLLLSESNGEHFDAISSDAVRLSKLKIVMGQTNAGMFVRSSSCIGRRCTCDRCCIYLVIWRECNSTRSPRAGGVGMQFRHFRSELLLPFSSSSSSSSVHTSPRLENFRCAPSPLKASSFSIFLVAPIPPALTNPYVLTMDDSAYKRGDVKFIDGVHNFQINLIIVSWFGQ